MNSPSTRATSRNDAPRMALRRFGRSPATTRSASRRRGCGRPRRGCAASIARQAGVERAVGVGQHEDDVRRGPAITGVPAEPGPAAHVAGAPPDPTTSTTAGIMIGSRQMNSSNRRSPGSAGRTQTSVGTSSTSMITTVTTASTASVDQDLRRRRSWRVAGRPGRASAQAEPGARRVGAELDHRGERHQEEAASASDHGRSPDAAAWPSPAAPRRGSSQPPRRRVALAARSSASHHDDHDHHHPEAERVADVLLARRATLP